MQNLFVLAVCMVMLFGCERTTETPKTDQSPSAQSPTKKAQAASYSEEDKLLGLPPVPIPDNNPQTPAKIVLGEKLFHDRRF